MITAAKKRMAPCPKWTMVMLGLTLVAMLALVDWTNSGVAKPLWMFFLPMAFGVAGGVIAATKKAYGWAAISAIFGIVSFQILNVVITLLQGP